MNPSGVASGRLWQTLIAAILLLFSFALNSCSAIVVSASPEATPTPTALPPDAGAILVYVYDGITRASVDGVVVRITNSPITDGIDHRGLQLPSCDAGQFLVVSAPGYETSFTACNGSNAYYVALNKVTQFDDSNYIWSPAYGDCDGCHRELVAGGYNEVGEWEKTAHAKVFVDPYFETMYRGINVSGQSQGPGFKLNFPAEAGNCAYCHAPSAVPSSLVETDLSSFYSRPPGASGEGVTCDICHKVSAVKLDGNNFPSLDLPGVQSLEFLRLSNSFVLGSFSNILLPAHDESKRHFQSSCSPILGTSEFCAACHYGKVNDMLVYNSYGEWRASWYGSNPNDPTYKTCQDCHMSRMDVNDNSTPLSLRSACSETSDRFQNSDHNLLDVGPDESGREIPRMIQNAARLKVKLKYEPENNNSIKVHVEVENMKAGHKFPTDSPLRHLILVVTAKDQFESPLEQVKGGKIPDWAGQLGRSLNGVEGYAGLAGTIYANLLAEDATGVSPTAAYWNKTSQASDTRLPPREPQAGNYFFAVPDLGDIHITVKLVYRYAFFDLLEQKGWVRPDVTVAVADCRVNLDQGNEFDCNEVKP